MIRTRIVRLDDEKAPDVWLPGIVRSLLKGGVIAYPTESTYALGAAVFSRRGMERVFRLKGRDRSKPLPLVVSDMDMLERICLISHRAFQVLAAEFWPGPLTLILPVADGWPDYAVGPGRTAAFRIPPLPWLRSLVQELGQPLTATSANVSGEPAFIDPEEVSAAFEGRLDILIDAGRTPGGAPSTIVDLSGSRPRVLREGRVPTARVAAALGLPEGGLST